MCLHIIHVDLFSNIIVSFTSLWCFFYLFLFFFWWMKVHILFYLYLFKKKFVVVFHLLPSFRFMYWFAIRSLRLVLVKILKTRHYLLFSMLLLIIIVIRVWHFFFVHNKLVLLYDGLPWCSLP